jgi:hypothetical protein
MSDIPVITAPATVLAPASEPPRHGESIPATTTKQEDLVVAGQRRINLIWEFTQAAVTILITCAAIYCAVTGKDADVLNFAFVAVISTYYARTNHTKTGGVGLKQDGR